MTRIFLTLAALPVVVAIASLLLAWKGVSGVIWRIDRAVDQLFERWM